MNQNFKSLVIVGAQWGDEGKGKVTDYFAQKADMVVRFAGGDNAGHMIEFGGERYKVTITPSGIFNPKVKNVIGNGCVVNLNSLVKEMNELNSKGISTSNLFISDRSHLIFEYHCQIDAWQEEQRKEDKIGTTKKGIGPAYSDKVSRYGFRTSDPFDSNFKYKFKQIAETRKDFYDNFSEFNFEKLYKNLMTNFNVIKNNIIDSGEFVKEYLDKEKFVLFEGAQGVLLDIDHGTYPFVTSSNTSANNVATGVGLHRKYINKVLGVVKAYNTRVGKGGMPTELFDKIGNEIRERGHEYGSNTKRPRRIGWLDLVALKYAIRVGGIDQLFLTLFDVLDTQDVIKIAIGYELDGKRINSLPALDQNLKRVVPVYLELPGWKEDITNVRSFHELPVNAQNYLRTIEKIVETPFIGFSVGPKREQTILMKEVFYD